MKRKFRLFALLFLLAFKAFGAEGPQSVWLPSDLASIDPLSPKTAIPRKDYLSDLETLERTMKAGYAGWSANRAPLEKAFVRLRAVNGFPLSSVQICQIVGHELSQVPDGHLMVSYLRATGACGVTPRTGQVGQNLTAQDCQGQDPQACTPPTWKYIENVNGTDVPVIAISTMTWRDATDWNGFLPRIESIKSNAKALIIDLRGNSGGDMEKAQQMARRLFGIEDDTIQISPPSRQLLAHTPEAFALAGNPHLLNVVVSRIFNTPVPQGENELYQYYLNRFNAALSGTSPAPDSVEIPPFTFDPSKIFKGPIRILVDSECASSCEWAVMFFERHPNAKVVGERTYGAFHFDNVGMTWLKRIGLFVNLPTAAVDFTSGHSLDLENHGLQPDLVVPPGQDALEVALKDARKD